MNEIKIKVGEQFCKDVIITAVESGIGYWARVTNYDPDAGTASIEEYEPTVYGPSDVARRFQLTPATVATGLQAIAKPGFEIGKQFRDSILGWAAADDACLDALEADAVIQAAVFGEIIYG